ncbi:hypothetical protein SDC9_125046 [bioreactor metagenome]|uniref:Uncharacterized protein n=1 Tax=bioreactor metagenome TaxID=1076179 RepID=A0A645CLZ6_9ZZZZ
MIGWQQHRIRNTQQFPDRSSLVKEQYVLLTVALYLFFQILFFRTISHYHQDIFIGKIVEDIDYERHVLDFSESSCEQEILLVAIQPVFLETTFTRFAVNIEINREVDNFPVVSVKEFA